MIGLRFQPFPTWERPTTRNRKHSAFQVDYSQAIDDLERELRYLEATEVILSTAHQPADIRADGWPYFSAGQRWHPGVSLYARTRYGPLSFASDAEDTWQSNFRAVSLTLEALRERDTNSTLKEGEVYHTFRGSPPFDIPASDSFTHQDDDRRQALLVMIREANLTLTNAERDAALQSEDACREIYRQAVLRAHPDTGGTAERFRAVMAAMELLRGTSK
jgi:hypothetical protein